VCEGYFREHKYGLLNQNFGQWMRDQVVILAVVLALALGAILMVPLNAARQPDGEANVDMMLGEYRKLDPGPVEEFIFFDPPGGRTRITGTKRWKTENPASVEEMTRKI